MTLLASKYCNGVVQSTYDCNHIMNMLLVPETLCAHLLCLLLFSCRLDGLPDDKTVH